MRASSISRALLGAAVVAVQLAAPDASAQTAPGKGPAKAPEGSEIDALLDELVQSGGADDDVAWLLSNADESAAPSGLVGKPVPAPALPSRGEGSRRQWDPRWRKFAFGNYVLTGATLAIGVGASLMPVSSSPWRTHDSFDESVRRSIGIQDRERGLWARDTSDVLLSVSLSYPLLLDSLIVVYWYRQSHAVAGQMALITAEALGVATAIQGVTAGLVSRERPYGRNCGGSIPGDLDDCTSHKRYRSFFSGHTAASFAAAGVACSHHFRHRVFGNATADALACGAGLLLAGAVGTLRIVGDEHYASDVLVGAGVGTLSGIGIPWLLHYGPLARVEGAPSHSRVTWNLVGVPNGIGVGGAF